MDFDFSEDQQQLRDAVRRWVDKGYSFERRRSIVATGGFDRGAWIAASKLGVESMLFFATFLISRQWVYRTPPPR